MINTENTASTRFAPTEASTRATGMGALDQKAFLRLMITQINNQDPTNPLKSAEFMGQLAQFATVAGIQGLQSTVERVTAGAGPARAMQAANLLDRHVLVPGSAAYLAGDGTGLSGAVALPDGAESLHLDVYTAAGEQVSTLALGRHEPGMAEFSWSGITADGQPMPAGLYTLKPRAMVAGEELAPELLVNAQVDSVRLGGPGAPIELGLRGLDPVILADVRRIN